MTLGMILLGAGAACRVLTIILIVVFCLNPPKYRPENEAVAMAGGGQTQPLRSGYQTNRLAMSRSLQTAGVQAAAPQAGAQVQAAPSPAQAPAPGTMPLPAAGAPVPQEPAAAWQGPQAAQPAPGTVVLDTQSYPQTVFLGAAQPAPETAVLGTQSYPQTVFLGTVQSAPGSAAPGGAPNEAPKAP